MEGRGKRRYAHEERDVCMCRHGVEIELQFPPKEASLVVEWIKWVVVDEYEIWPRWIGSKGCSSALMRQRGSAKGVKG